MMRFIGDFISSDTFSRAISLMREDVLRRNLSLSEFLEEDGGSNESVQYLHVYRSAERSLH